MTEEFDTLLDSPETYQGEVFRNIPSIRDSQDLFDDLSEDASHYEIAISLEEQTKSVATPNDPTIDRPFDYGVIDYPFDCGNWRQSRFSDGSFGVFYGSLESDTTIYETVYHWLDFMNDSEGFLAHGSTTDRRLHVVEVDAVFYDCTEKYVDHPGLVHPSDYQFTNILGAHLHEQDRDGLLTKSARCEGVNAPTFRRDRLKESNIHCYFTYTVDPISEVVVVERQVGEPYLELSWQDAYLQFVS